MLAYSFLVYKWYHKPPNKGFKSSQIYIYLRKYLTWDLNLLYIPYLLSDHNQIITNVTLEYFSWVLHNFWGYVYISNVMKLSSVYYWLTYEYFY